MYTICHLGSDTFYSGVCSSNSSPTHFFVVFADDNAVYANHMRVYNNLSDLVYTDDTSIPTIVAFSDYTKAEKMLNYLLTFNHMIFSKNREPVKIYEPIIREEFDIVSININPNQILN